MGVCGGGWCIGAISGPYGISLWKNISRGWPSFSRYILYEIGDRLRVKFWKTGGENVFSIVFSRTQPNTKKYFSKYFLKCHQTPENIFFFEKYFHLKIFYTWKTFYIEPNTALVK